MLEQLASDFTPRYERQREDVLMLDISGLGRIVGPPRVVGEELRRVGADRGLYVSVAIASTRTAARLMVEARAGVSLIEPQHEAKALCQLPITLLTVLVEPDTACVGVGARRTPSAVGRHESPVRKNAHGSGSSRHYRMAPAPILPDSAEPAPSIEEETLQDALDTLRRWGIKTLGELAALPAAALFERLGTLGLTLQSWARGEDGRPLVRALPIPRFVETLELEWPIDTLEPLSFVLSRLFEPLCHRLEQHDLAAAVVRVHLTLVSREQIARTLQLPAPMRDPKVLRTLVLLDLEARPPHAGIDRVTLEIEPALGRIVQHSLLVRALPAPEQLSTLVARLTALMGEGRCGAPALLDTHRSSAFTMRPFHPAELSLSTPSRTTRAVGTPASTPSRTVRTMGAPVAHGSPSHQRFEGEGGGRVSEDLRDARGTPSTLALVLRRFRNPIAVRVTCEKGRPVRVASGRRGLGGGRIVTASGPWRTSGEWWSLDNRPGAGARTAWPVRGEVDAEALTAPPVRDRVDAVAWDHDEWDVELGDGRLWRLAYARDLDRWLMHGQYD